MKTIVRALLGRQHEARATNFPTDPRRRWWTAPATYERARSREYRAAVFYV